MKRLVRVFTWSPCGKQPAHFHVFNMLWVWSTVVVLMLSLPSWLGHSVSFPSQVPDPSTEELSVEEWNAFPLQLGGGVCMDVASRARVECP